MAAKEAPYVIRPVGEGDLSYLANHLRPEDARELKATYGHSEFLDVLTNAVALSEEAQVAVTAEGHPAMLWGIVPFSRRASLAWGCGTPELFKHTRGVVLHSRETIKRWFVERPSIEYLTNFTHSDNRKHHHWLEWCGAELFPATPMGPLGELFRPFLIRRTKYHV